MFREQHHDLQSEGKHFSQTLNGDEEKETWQNLARVLDRVFLVFYILCFAGVTIVFMANIIEG